MNKGLEKDFKINKNLKLQFFFLQNIFYIEIFENILCFILFYKIRHL